MIVRCNYIDTSLFKIKDPLLKDIQTILTNLMSYAKMKELLSIVLSRIHHNKLGCKTYD